MSIDRIGLAGNGVVAPIKRSSRSGPALPPGAARQQHWQLGFPGDDLEGMRSFCDQVDQQVQALLAQLQPPTP
jgi:hypothetical protein